MITVDWSINEEERKRILNLHEVATKNEYLIFEQLDNNSFSVDFQNAFNSGQYDLTPQYQSLVDNNVRQIAEYIKGKQLKNFKLLITAGESQVPNPKGFEQKGSLATKRAESLKGYLQTVLPNILNYTPQIEIAPPIIGKTPWDGVNKDDNKYKQEQFVKVSVVIDAASTQNGDTSAFQIDASRDEPIHDANGHTIGYISYASRNSNSIANAGNLNTGTQNVFFYTVHPDSQPKPENITAKYSIPFNIWNNRQGASQRVLTPQDLQNFKTYQIT